MKRARSVTPMAPRASSTLNWCAALATKSYAGSTSFWSRALVAAAREEPLGLGLVAVERVEVRAHVGLLEVVRRPLPLGALADLAVEDPVGPGHVVDAVLVLQVHRDPLEAVGELARDRPAVDARRPAGSR